VVDVTETNTALCLNIVSIDNVILNNTNTFIHSVGLVDVTETDIELCLNSVSFSSVILNDTSTPVFSVGRMVLSTRHWYYIIVLDMVPNTSV
jgi:hypothetical protein